MTVTPPNPILPIGPMNGITPFTHRDGLTYLQLLEHICEYIQGGLIAEIQEKIDELNLTNSTLANRFNELMVSTQTQIDAILSQANGRLDELLALIQTQIDAVDSITTELNNFYNTTTANIDARLADMRGVIDQFNAQLERVDQQLELLDWPVVQFINLTPGTNSLVVNSLYSRWPVEYIITQDSVGSRTLSLPSNVTGIVKLNTAPNSTTRIRLIPTGDNTWAVDTYYSAVVNRMRYYASGTRELIGGGSWYNGFPSTAKNNGVLMLAYGQYVNHYGGGNGLQLRRSLDMGNTWVAIAPPIADPSGGNSCAAMTPIGANGFGMLLMVGSPYRCYFSRSDNGGISWSTPVQIDTRYGTDLVWVNDGTPDGLLIATAYWGDGIWVYRSTNRGTTWASTTIPQMSGTGNPLSECSVMHLGGTELIMMLRYTPNAEVNNYYLLARSSNLGVTWTAPQQVIDGASGQPRLHRLPNGHIITGLRAISETNGARKQWGYAISRDNGYTWELSTDIGPEMMMYGNFVTHDNGDVYLYGSHQTSPTRAQVWRMRFNEAIQETNALYDTGWVQIPLSVNVTAGYYPVYRRVGKTIYLRGSVNVAGGISGSDGVRVTSDALEDWARPAAPIRVPVTGGMTAAAQAVGGIQIESSGVVTAFRVGGPAGGTDGAFYLSGVSYTVDH